MTCFGKQTVNFSTNLTGSAGVPPALCHSTLNSQPLSAMSDLRPMTPMTSSSNPPRPWQRQPDEAAADFHAFACYLRLKGRRSLRAVAALTGRSLSSLRRVSARFDWPNRVHTFEERLAEATQDAVDSVILTGARLEKSRL